MVSIEFNGKNVKKLLKSYGAKMTDLSRKSGVPYNSLNHYLNGYQKPGPENRKKIYATLSSMEDANLVKKLGLGDNGAR